MKSDSRRRSGFYWVRFEGQPVIAEYMPRSSRCSTQKPHWHMPQSESCWLNHEVCELLSDCLQEPVTAQPKEVTTDNLVEDEEGNVWHWERKSMLYDSREVEEIRLWMSGQTFSEPYPRWADAIVTLLQTIDELRKAGDFIKANYMTTTKEASE